MLLWPPQLVQYCIGTHSGRHVFSLTALCSDDASSRMGADLTQYHDLGKTVMHSITKSTFVDFGNAIKWYLSNFSTRKKGRNWEKNLRIIRGGEWLYLPPT